MTNSKWVGWKMGMSAGLALQDLVNHVGDAVPEVRKRGTEGWANAIR
jgi:hypothetical protein